MAQAVQRPPRARRCRPSLAATVRAASIVFTRIVPDPGARSRPAFLAARRRPGGRSPPVRARRSAARTLHPSRARPVSSASSARAGPCSSRAATTVAARHRSRAAACSLALGFARCLDSRRPESPSPATHARRADARESLSSGPDLPNCFVQVTHAQPSKAIWDCRACGGGPARLR